MSKYQLWNCMKTEEMNKYMRAIGFSKNLRTDENAEEYYSCIKDIIENKLVLSMGEYHHHFTTTCLQHSINVSYYCYLICKYLDLDYRSAARAGLLHDFFLYDWTTHKKETGKSFHGITHPKIAYRNAKKYFELNRKEKDMIIKHMWPLTIALPRYKESYIIMLVDKYCGTLEIMQYFFGRVSQAF